MRRRAGGAALLLLAMLLCGTAARAQALLEIPFPGGTVRPLGRYAYVDQFSEGLAAFNEGGRRSPQFNGYPVGGAWGYLREDGSQAVPAQFAFAEPFADGQAVVQRGGDNSFVPYVTGSPSPLANRAHPYCSGGWGVIGETGTQVLPAIYKDVERLPDGTFKILMETGAEKDDSFASALYPGGRWGLAGPDGSVRIAPQWRVFEYYAPGIYIVCQEAPWHGLAGDYGLVNGYGTAVTARMYHMLEPCQEGRAVAAVGGEKESGAFGYYYAGAAYSYLDEWGGAVTAPSFAEAKSFRDGFAWAAIRRGDKMRWGLIDKAGHWRAAPRYEEPSFAGGTAWKTTDGERTGYLDLAQGLVLEPAYQDIEHFSEGLCAAERDGLWGYIDTSGKWVIPPQFTWAEPFCDGMAVARAADERWGAIGRDGAWRIEPVYDGLMAGDDVFITQRYADSSFTEYRDASERERRYGWMLRENDTIREIAPPVYEKVKPMDGGSLYWEQNGLFGISRADGTRLAAAPCQYAQCWGGLVHYYLGPCEGLADSQGRFSPLFSQIVPNGQSGVYLARQGALWLRLRMDADEEKAVQP